MGAYMGGKAEEDAAKAKAKEDKAVGDIYTKIFSKTPDTQEAGYYLPQDTANKQKGMTPSMPSRSTSFMDQGDASNGGAYVPGKTTPGHYLNSEEQMAALLPQMAAHPALKELGNTVMSNFMKKQESDRQNAKLLAPYAGQMSTLTPEMQALAEADPAAFIKTMADISIKKTEPAKQLEGEDKHVADYVKNHPNMPVGQAELAGRREWALAGHVASSSDTNPGFQQAQSAFMLPDGTKVTPIFDKHRGYGTLDDGKFTPLPKGARPVTLGTGGPMPMVQVAKLKQDFINEDTALNRMNRYFGTVGSADVGIARWADKVAGNVKTAFGAKTLSSGELNAQIGQGQLQGLLGLFRTDIVGPGVMTEYDAERVISALGGDFSQLQNPAVVKQLLTDLYQDKQRRLDAYQSDINYNKPYYPNMGFPSRTSSTSLGGNAPAAQNAAPGAGGGKTKTGVGFKILGQ
jgi:hypothetical protein